MAQRRVLVVGGGVAGLSAARTLSEAGLHVTLFEASNRLGGRVRSVAHGPGQAATELGAEFVHGRPREVLDLVEADGLEIVEVVGPRLRMRGGKLVAGEDFMGAVDDLLDGVSLEGPDLSMLAYVESKKPSRDLRARVLAYIEGFHAADPAKVSAQSLARNERTSAALHSESTYIMPGGYDQIVGALERRLDRRRVEIVFGAQVDEVRWQRGRVEVRARGKVHRGDAVVMALPLGVLQSGAVRFSPPLWPRKRALAGQTTGHVLRFTVRLREPVWHESPHAWFRKGWSFLFTDDDIVPTWWRRGDTHSVVGWAGASYADRLPKDAASRRTKVLERLAHHLALPLARVREVTEEVAFHDWQTDPLFRGAYTYALVGGDAAPITLSTPLEQTLVFAGEFVDTSSQTGTVHGAIASGRRAAVGLL